MQQLGGASTDTSAREIAQTEACLSRLLGYSKGVASVICDEGGVGIMLDLLRDTDSMPIVTLALKVLSYLANGEAAQDILETEGTRIISQWVRGDTDASGDPEARIWVRMSTKLSTLIIPPLSSFTTRLLLLTLHLRTPQCLSQHSHPGGWWRPRWSHSGVF